MRFSKSSISRKKPLSLLVATVTRTSLREPNFAPFPTLALWGPTQPSLYNETTMWLSKLTLEIFLDSEYYNYDYIDLK
jgi:hypothetical protein